jgi:two-component system, OmpR family, phosphate regulon sensor histidine kinase PhoR
MTDGLDAERIAVLVHEVRSPVAALSAIAETLSEAELDHAARLELARLSISACRGVERIVTDVAVASIHTERVDADELVRQAVAAAALRGALVDADLALDLPEIDGDPARLRQVLDNLISNAVRHGSPTQAVLVRAEVDGMLRISVSDSGDGIPLEQQERIFDVGVRLDPESPGAGLGLPLARAIAEAHGGSLTVASAPGAGTTFTLALPLRDV